MNVAGNSYVVPSIVLSAGQNTVQIQDPAGPIASTRVTLVGKPNFYSAQRAIIGGVARVEKCADLDGCMPTNYKVTDLTPTSSLAFSGISGRTVAGSKFVNYINYDLAFDLSWDGSGTNILNVSFAVNGGKTKMWSFPISGGDWQDTGRMGVLLDGLKAGSDNSIVVSAPGWRFSPDIVGLDILA